MKHIRSTLLLVFLPFVLWSLMLLLLAQKASAAEQLAEPLLEPMLESLPDPLSLESALAISQQSNVVLSKVENELLASRIRTDSARTDTGVNVALKARARWVESPVALRWMGREDHAAKIVVSKSLYDFGRTSNKVHARERNEEIAELLVKQVSQAHRLKVMRSFFDVLLADLMYARDNEAMAMGYIYYDRTKERASLGQKSELDVLEKNSFYQATRQARYESESRQRLSRDFLSQLLDRPGQLPSKLTMPLLSHHKLKIKEVKELTALALENNLELRILQKQLAALKHEVKSIRAQRFPIVSAELESGVYERDIGGNDVWRAGVIVEVPLFQGGKVSADSALKKNEIKNLEFKLYQKQQQIKHEILEHWLALNDLKIQALASETLFDYREYYLDRARALYEMEFKSDLGDSMVALSAASLKVADAKFETAMRWEILAQLTQRPIAEMAIEDLAAKATGESIKEKTE